MSFSEKNKRLADERAAIASGNGSAASKRLDLLFDPGSFVEAGAFIKQRPTEYEFALSKGYEPVITGWGTVDGAPIYAFSEDSASMGGAVSEMHAAKICNILDMAAKTASPVVAFIDTRGAKLAEGVDALNGYSKIIAHLARLSGVVPTVAIINGPCGGAGAMIAGCFDFVVMVKGSELYMTSPQVIKASIGKVSDASAEAKAKKGSADFVAADDGEAASIARALISYLPQNNSGDKIFSQSSDDINRKLAIEGFIPENKSEAADMNAIVSAMADNGKYLECSAAFGTSILCAFAKLDGETVGIIANKGDITVDGAIKAVSFITVCDSFDIPLVTLVDAGGFPVCDKFESRGGSKYAAKLAAAYAGASVAKISVVVRKAIGSAYVAMCSKGLGADAAYALPSAEIAPMPIEAMVNVLFGDEIAQLDNPITQREELYSKYEGILTSPFEAAKRGYIDDVISPAELRQRVIYAVEMFAVKRDDCLPKKHGNLSI